MRRYLLLLVFMFLCQIAYPQADSLHTPLDGINSLASLHWLKDSLTINAWADSLRASAQSKFSPDSIHLKNKIDSLTSLRLSTEPYTSQLDSLLTDKQRKFSEIGDKQQELASTAKSRLDQWQQNVQARFDSIGFKGKIPDVSIPGLKQQELPSFNIPEVPALSADDFASLDLSEDLSILNQELPFASVDGLKGVQENLAIVTKKLSLASELRNNAGQSIEDAIGELDAVSEIKKQMKAVEAIKPPADPVKQLPDADQMKEQAIEKAVDHFAGKDEQLNQAMEKVSKYKQKYSSVQSLKDLPKKVPNPMKEKPFIERLAPSLALQILKKDNLLLDISPYIGYKFTGRLRVGVGWNQRVTFNSEKLFAQTNVYGPRIYGEYNVFKGISGRLELETMNCFVPQVMTNTDVGQREWVPAILAGMKQEYKIFKNLKGTALVLYNFYNPDYKSPYGDRLNVRFGFEYSVKKKVKNAKSK